MRSFREQTYYELLEVQRSAPTDEVRAALARALEVYSPDSVALYALVDEHQAEALRARLREAARVLLDPAARAGYDRMLGLEPLPEPASLWAEDEEDEEEAEEEEEGGADGAALGPYPRGESDGLASEASGPSGDPVQTSLGLEGPPARWPAREPMARAEAPPARPPGLPAPRPPAGAPSPTSRVGRAGAPGHGPGPGASTGHDPAPPAVSVRADAEVRPRMPELAPEVEFNGELLRQVREARGLTLQQLAERTRIGRAHLERVEADRYADLPAPVYLRGILVSMARELKLDAARVSKSYLLLAARSGRPEP